MKKFFLLSIIFFATKTFGQGMRDFPVFGHTIPNNVRININSNDTALRVLYDTTLRDPRIPAFYLNGKLVNETFILTMRPELIDSFHVTKDIVEIKNVKYYGQIHVKTRKSYNPKIISLTGLKDKYTNLKSARAVFMVEGEIVTTDYDQYVVDENYIFRIIVENVENAKENVHFKLIKLLMKSEENIKKSKEFRIRGTSVSMAKLPATNNTECKTQ